MADDQDEIFRSPSTSSKIRLRVKGLGELAKSYFRNSWHAGDSPISRSSSPILEDDSGQHPSPGAQSVRGGCSFDGAGHVQPHGQPRSLSPPIYVRQDEHKGQCQHVPVARSKPIPVKRSWGRSRSFHQRSFSTPSPTPSPPPACVVGGGGTHLLPPNQQGRQGGGHTAIQERLSSTDKLRGGKPEVGLHSSLPVGGRSPLALAEGRTMAQGSGGFREEVETSRSGERRPEAVVESSPEVTPMKARPTITRVHSLRYSGGALHNAETSASFDHNFESPSENDSGGSSPYTNSSPISRGSAPRTSPPSAIQRVYSKSTGDKSLLESAGQHRSRAGNRLPPLIRVQNESSNRLPRTRASYSLSRKERNKESSDLGSECSQDSPSQRHQPEGNSSEMGVGGVVKSASMSNMSSGSESDWLTNSIPASEARKRSYLVGSVGPTSLLGTQELEKQFPDRTIRIFIGSWNMNGQVPPRHLCEFLLPSNLKYVPDVLVVGTQETFPEKTEWEIRLQDTLGPSHVLFHSASLGTLHLTIFLRRDLIWYCSIPEEDSFSTRPGAQFKTKGAVAVGFILFGTSFLFINSHLTAHQENVMDRVKDLKRIYAMLNLPKTLPLKKRQEIFDNYDCVFWCGDLNFRLEQSREEIIRDIQDGVSVLETDQLTWLMQEGTVFRGFQEHPITFRPTYKYDPGTDNFDTSSKQRIPSYTDRILYKHQPSTKVTSLYYDSVQGVTTSDHKPVWGMFQVVIRPGRDSVPLAGGLFNRQVYLEGLKRRSESLKPIIGKGGNVNMCTIS